ncbi:hypothetical protein L227DRAFT_652677 [Lentinus tigrinus ALCF2SS1-6]|uniref:F-box domain-containing protein n=1 Tax=Lentinus tigrinus ALCF2SS1-6 TaxID=1328759 RepID=A0A5C2SC68_9APHY|nr:hypothetical protein L227DRAFT_652677 [Lentinus tigrinus ALCF2SS1-6]
MTTISESTLYRLDDLICDVLIRIIASIESVKDLVSLSATCRYLRTLCVPLMFSHATRYIDRPMKSKRVILQKFRWPYVRHFKVVDVCPDRMYTVSKGYNGLMFARDPYLCGVLESPKLFSLLRHMPRLTKISLIIGQGTFYIHGISLPALMSILTLPQLRELSVIHLLLSQTESASFEDHTIIAPLTLFHHERSVSRRYPPTDAEKANIILFLTKLCSSLKVLTLPAELVPTEAVSQLDWPRLCELRLRGAQWKTPSVPYATLFSRMRDLRVLVLELTLSADAEPRPILDHDDADDYPWPHLEELSVSHPVVDDPVYARLPQCLRVLSLSCYPHVAERPFLDGNDPFRPYGFPLQTSSEMLDILQRCRARDLSELHLEYRADESESTLLGFVSSALPKIQILQIYRYRAPNTSDIAVDEFARLLSSLAALRVLKVHLDLENTPLPDFSMRPAQRGFEEPWAYDDLAMKTFADDQRVIAETLAGILSPSVKEIHLWWPADSGRHLWRRFRIDHLADNTEPRRGTWITRDDVIIYADHDLLC